MIAMGQQREKTCQHRSNFQQLAGAKVHHFSVAEGVHGPRLAAWPRNRRSRPGLVGKLGCDAYCLMKLLAIATCMTVLLSGDAKAAVEKYLYNCPVIGKC
jgi:hypothetical protein